ncbi:NUDIX hydrolase [Ruminococcus sp. NK3A76]|uniref:NUDIX domain-containing protein n=1 Tax=Ruminococcus sp. NK3A76 TaxID=877411 RepID=UPI00048DA5D9|nr:NUDIX hydrolase [Ruminococcus sp. NK3A76]
MSEENTNWGQSVAGVVIKDGKVLLARHTYGNGKGMLIIPGGYVQYGESPQDALRREYMEETGIRVEPVSLIGVRFNAKDWYMVFLAEYVSGEAVSDGDENSEVLWLSPSDAISREDVPDLTKKMIESATANSKGLMPTQFVSRSSTPSTLYSVR